MKGLRWAVSTHPAGVTLPRPLAILAVEQVADGFAASGVSFAVTGVQRIVCDGSGFIIDAAFGAAIGEARLIGFQFELFGTDDAGFDRVRHFS